MPPRRRRSRQKPTKAKKKPARRKADPVKQWANYLQRYRPGLQRYVLDALTETYGPQVWEARLDPTSELILTILTQNTADTNAEKAYEALRAAPIPAIASPRSTTRASAGAATGCRRPRPRTGRGSRTRRCRS